MNATTILIIVNVFAAISIIALALVQQTKGDMGSALGGGGGGSGGMFGARGSANFLSRCTSVMCAVFFISSLALAYVYAQRGADSRTGGSSVIEQISESEVPTVETSTNAVDEVPSVDEVPDAEELQLPDFEEAPSVDDETLGDGDATGVTESDNLPSTDAQTTLESAVEDVSDELETATSEDRN